MFKACKSLILLMSCALLVPLALADDLLRADHPDRYTVVKGDTLWDISGRFLRSPWRWPEIWHVNPQIANPHLIYPGDQLELVYIDGKPQLRLSRGPLKLSPTVRSSPWDGAIPTIPVDAIGPFLTRPYVLDEGELDSAPYIVDFSDEHILGGAGWKAYVRAITQRGLLIEEQGHVTTAPIFRVVDNVEALGIATFDLVLITTKAFDTALAAVEASRVVRNDATVVVLQNGVGGIDVARGLLSKEGFFSGVTTIPQRKPAES